MKAYLKQVRISPKKANLVAALVRRKKIVEAIDILKFTPKKTAGVLKKLIESAAANAENNFNQEKNTLYIKEILVTEGPTYKRRMPISKGRTHPILKRTSHITVKLETEIANNGNAVKKQKEVSKKNNPEIEAVEKTAEKPQLKIKKPNPKKVASSSETKAVTKKTRKKSETN